MDLSAEEGARAVALGLRAEASDAAEGLAAGAGDEPLHDFRVALRRASATRLRARARAPRHGARRGIADGEGLVAEEPRRFPQQRQGRPSLALARMALRPQTIQVL